METLDPDTGYRVTRKGNLVLPHEPPPLPDWLSSPIPDPEPSQELTTSKLELSRAHFDAVFVHVLDRVAGGEDLYTIISTDPRRPPYRQFMRWVKMDPDRKAQYSEALEIRAEKIMGETLRIADGNDSVEDVARSKLRIDQRNKVAGFDNKDRFAPSTNVNISQDISISRVFTRLDDAMARVMLPREDIEDVSEK